MDMEVKGAASCTALHRIAEIMPNRVTEPGAVFRRALCCPHDQCGLRLLV